MRQQTLSRPTDPVNSYSQNHLKYRQDKAIGCPKLLGTKLHGLLWLFYLWGRGSQGCRLPKETKEPGKQEPVSLASQPVTKPRKEPHSQHFGKVRAQPSLSNHKTESPLSFTLLDTGAEVSVIIHNWTDRTVTRQKFAWFGYGTTIRDFLPGPPTLQGPKPTLDSHVSVLLLSLSDHSVSCFWH